MKSGRWILRICVAIPALHCTAQVTTQISGLVVDNTGAAVGGAKVTLRREGTTSERTVLAGESGRYSVPFLAPGQYTLRAEASGFAPTFREHVTVFTDRPTQEDVVLQVGAVSQTVTATVNAVQAESAAVGTAIDRAFAANLPLNGRSFGTLFLQTPGTVPDTGGTFEVNGQRGSQNQYNIDGVSANYGVNTTATLSTSAGGAVTGLSSTGGTNTLVSVDALQEFQVQTSTYAPEFGRTPGGQVQITTRSGTGHFHGTAFDYLRNNFFDANDTFNKRFGIARPPHRQNDFGGVLGGPVTRKGTYFFFSYEGLRLVQPVTEVGDAPTALARQQSPTPTQAILALFPLPTGPSETDSSGNLTGLGQYATSFGAKYKVDATSIRIDQSIGNRLTLFGRYAHSPSYSQGPNGPFTVDGNQFSNETGTIGATLTLSRHLTSDTRVNYSRSNVVKDQAPNAAGAGSATFASLTAGREDTKSLWSVNLLYGNNTFIAWGLNNTDRQEQWNAIENIAGEFGRHLVKVGFDFRRLAPAVSSGDFLNANLITSNSDLVTGLDSLAYIFNLGHTALSLPAYAVYAQDNWRLGSRLVLTYGLRWDVAPAPAFHEQFAPFALTQITQPSQFQTASEGTRLYDTNYGAVAPRVGLAFRLHDQPGSSTVLRAGAGNFYDVQPAALGDALSGPPSSTYVNFASVPFPLSNSQLAVPAISTAPPYNGFQGFDPHLALQYSTQWSAALEQELGKDQTLTLTCVGSAGRHLQRVQNYAGVNDDFQGVTSIVVNNGASSYNSLQAQFNRRLVHGLQLLTSYTWAHSIDNASNQASGSVPGPNYTSRQDRGPSDFDVQDAFTLALHYEPERVPGPAAMRAVVNGWSFDATMRAQSAEPVNPTLTATIDGYSVAVRPDRSPDNAPLYLSNASLPGGRQLNPNAVCDFTGTTPNSNPACAGVATITTLSQLRQGTFPRNGFRGFGYYEPDISAARLFPIHDAWKLQFRGDFFNVVNHPAYANPPGLINSLSGFGISQSSVADYLAGANTNTATPQIYAQGGPRSIQLSLKLLF